MENRKNSPILDLPPDSVPGPPHPRIDKAEAALIGVLLALIVGGNVYTRLLPPGEIHPIGVERGPESRGLPPVDWLATPVPLKIPPKDVNLMGHADLVALPGVGPTLAAQILAARERKGRFQSLEELDEISGIGPRKLDTLREYLFTANPPDSASKESSPATIQDASTPILQSLAASEGVTPAHSNSPVRLNTATQEELESIPGIGKTFAERILARRALLGRFRSWAEIGEVSGIGEKRLENIKGCATID
jgi:competence ComEA-like helix-hairpin-helix protein